MAGCEAMNGQNGIIVLLPDRTLMFLHARVKLMASVAHILYIFRSIKKPTVRFLLSHLLVCNIHIRGEVKWETCIRDNKPCCLAKEMDLTTDLKEVV